ncbi:MAG: pyrroline-5-carboxylate reductase [Alteromonadaceae bacterium]|nr:MAG: pyrroline-5-carboxylate reductase [Alteromonadaceae bacterium]
MASCILGGLVKQGFPANNIYVSAPDQPQLDALEKKYQVRTSADNAACAGDADILVLAVKPQILSKVCLRLSEHLSPGTLVISVAAGIDCESISGWLNDHQAIVRCMPNTPALVQEGASGLFATDAVSETQRQNAAAIMASVGKVCWIEDEQLMHPITALSGSGPAYFFLFIESMIETAVKQGLDPIMARTLAIQTALGAATLAGQSDVDVAELRRRVTSPNGTTEQAIATFEAKQLRGTVEAAMEACSKRSQELALEAKAVTAPK